MLHYGKTPSGELEIRAADEGVRYIYQALSQVKCDEAIEELKTYIINNFEEELYG